MKDQVSARSLQPYDDTLHIHHHPNIGLVPAHPGICYFMAGAREFKNSKGSQFTLMSLILLMHSCFPFLDFCKEMIKTCVMYCM